MRGGVAASSLAKRFPLPEVQWVGRARIRARQDTPVGMPGVRAPDEPHGWDHDASVATAVDQVVSGDLPSDPVEDQYRCTSAAPTTGYYLEGGMAVETQAHG